MVVARDLKIMAVRRKSKDVVIYLDAPDTESDYHQLQPLSTLPQKQERGNELDREQLKVGYGCYLCIVQLLF